MAEINILESKVYNLISAGEVVERPASVVKELVENSIDAGAQNITISIKSGGGKEIAITDDGCGIDEKNLKKCCLPHATSKLSSPSDLQKICTLGFRGEALPSICAVAQVYISSKTEQQTLGNFIRNHGGVEVESGQIGQSTGTTVVVSNLFFNIPVRAKFLKNDKQEQSYVTTIVQQLIFANPQIKIKYIADGKTLLHSNGDLESCIYTIYGNDIANQMIFFDSEFSDIKVCGYCGNRFCSKNNRTFQIIVVNGRAIVDANIQVAVAQAYGNSLMKRQYPIFAISIELPFDEVDVNVHPSKNQVRFQDNHKIFSCVYKAISLALAKNESVAMFSNNSNEKNVFVDNNSYVAIQKVSEDIVKKFENNIENCVQNNNENDTKSSKILQSEAAPTDFANSDHGKFLDNSSLIKNEYQSSLSAHQKSNMLSDNKNCNNDNDSDNIDKNNNDEINFCDNIDIKENEKINKLISQQQEKINDCSVEKNSAVSKVSNTLSQTIGGSIFEHGASFDNVFNDSKTNFQKEVDKEVDNIFEQIELSLQDEITIVGQIFKTYLIVQKNDKAYLVDQHACHERILYDQLILQIDNSQILSQDLITPYIFDCALSQYEFMLAMLDNLNSLGFEIEEFGDMSFKVNSVPTIVCDINLKKFFDELLDDKKSFGIIKASDLIKDKLAQMACKAAIKAGDSLNLTQIKSLLGLMKNGATLQCPHGRPAIVEFCRNDLDKIFKRIV